MKTLSLLIITLFIVTGCTPKQEAPAPQPETEEMSLFEDITPAELDEIAAGDPDVIILDVRTDEEVAEGMIEGAIQIDYRSPDFRDKIAELDSSKTYIVYCRSGGRSSATCEILTQELGFENVKNLEGGYSAYSESE